MTPGRARPLLGIRDNLELEVVVGACDARRCEEGGHQRGKKNRGRLNGEGTYWMSTSAFPRFVRCGRWRGLHQQHLGVSGCSKTETAFSFGGKGGGGEDREGAAMANMREEEARPWGPRDLIELGDERGEAAPINSPYSRVLPQPTARVTLHLFAVDSVAPGPPPRRAAFRGAPWVCGVSAPG